MARKAKTATALSTNVVPVPVIEGPLPIIEGEIVATIGDNSGAAMNTLPSYEDMSAALALTMRRWSEADTSADMQQLDAALRIMQRHELLVAKNTGVALPTLATLATVPNNNAVFSNYLRDLVDEFAGKYINKAERKGREDDDKNAYRAKVNTRMTRALELASILSWFKVPREAYDFDKRAWRVAPSCFVPPGWMCVMLTHKQDGENMVPVPYVYLAADTRHANYTANNAKGALALISVSIAQLRHSFDEHLKVKTSEEPIESEANKASAQRAARQTGQDGKGNGETNATPKAEHTDDNPPSGKADRTFYVSEFNKHLMALAKIINVDVLTPVKFKDFNNSTWQVLTELSMIEARIKAEEFQGVDNGKVPAKRTASK